jgi:hypothetical protein
MSRLSDLADLEFAINAAYLADQNFDLIGRRAFFLEPTDGTSASSPASGTWSVDELFVDTARRVWRCTVAGTPGTWVLVQSATAPVGANPTASAGPTATNGSASTFMRSDGAPAINQSAAYNWTEMHGFLKWKLEPNGTTVLSSDGGSIALNANLQPISSNSTTATDRTFSLGTSLAVAGQVYVLRWVGGSNRGQLINSGTAVLTEDWMPENNHLLGLYYDGTSFRELFRHPASSSGGITAADDVTWTGQHTFEQGPYIGPNSESEWGAMTGDEVFVASFNTTLGDPNSLQWFMQVNDGSAFSWINPILTKTTSTFQMATYGTSGEWMVSLETSTTNARIRLVNESGQDRFTCNANAGSHHLAEKTTLTDAATSLFDIALPTLKAAGGRIAWTIIAIDGSDAQCLSGITTFAVVNKGGVYTKQVTTDTANLADARSTGTLSATFNLLDGTNKVTMQVTPSGSLTETTYEIYWTLDNLSPQAVTIL